MNRLKTIHQYVYKTITNCTSSNKQDEMLHIYGVYHYALLLAKKRHLNYEIMGCIALLHDLARVTYTTRNHAVLGAKLANEYLLKEKSFTNQEIEIIVSAIKNHSTKKEVHDAYSECIKDADLLQHYFMEPDAIFSTPRQSRLDKICKELHM